MWLDCVVLWTWLGDEAVDFFEYACMQALGSLGMHFFGFSSSAQLSVGGSLMNGGVTAFHALLCSRKLPSNLCGLSL